MSQLKSACHLRHWGEPGSKKLDVLFYQGYGMRLSPWATDRAGHIHLKSSLTREYSGFRSFMKCLIIKIVMLKIVIILKQQIYKTQCTCYCESYQARFITDNMIGYPQNPNRTMTYFLRVRDRSRIVAHEHI